MTLYAVESQRFGLAKESVRGTAESAPAKWYPSRGMVELSYALQHLSDEGIRGIAAEYAPVAGVKVGEGKIPLVADAQVLGEFLYALLGTVASAEDTTITIGATNNKLDFNIGGGELTATIASATYAIGTSQATVGSLCKAIYDAIVAAEATGTYTVSYSRTTKLFTITRSAGTFQILWKTGTNGSDGTGNTIGSTLGYLETADDTGGLTYASDSQVEYAFTHTITQSTSIQKQAYTFFLDRGLEVHKYNLGTVKKVSFKSGVDGLVEVDADILFKTEATGSIGSPSFPTQRYHSFQQVDFKIAGSSNTDVKEWNLDIDNTAAALRTLSLSQDVTDIVAAGKIMIEGGFTIYFSTLTERAKFLANTAVALRVLMQGATIAGSSKWTTDINIYAAHYKAFPFGEDQGLLAAKVSFKGHYSTSDSKAIQVATTNQDVSY